jgi:hypothetical protein
MLRDIELNCSEIAETIEGRAATVNAELMSLGVRLGSETLSALASAFSSIATAAGIPLTETLCLFFIDIRPYFSYVLQGSSIEGRHR